MTTTQDRPNLDVLANHLREQITADGTLVLGEGGLLGENVEALVHSFLPGYTLAISGANVAIADDGVHISGHTALPVIGDLAADITLSVGDGLQMALNLAALPGAAMDLAAVLGYLLPGSDGVPTLTVTKLNLTIDTAQRSAAAHTAVEGNWSVEVGTTTLALRSMALELNHADGVTNGTITGVTDFAGATLVVTAAHDAGQWMFAAEQQQNTSLQLGAVAQALTGATLPDEVPDVALDGVALKVTPSSGAFTFAAQSAATWNLPIAIENLRVTAHVTAKRAAAEDGQSPALVNFSIDVGAPGPFPVIDGLYLSDIALSFAHADGGWKLAGELGAALFERPVTLHASLEDSADERVISLDGVFSSDAPLITFADGALHGSEITLVITKPKVAQGAAPAEARWSLSATGGMTVGDFFDSRGTLEVEHAPDGSSFVFTSDTAQAHIPVPMPNIAPDPQIALALSRIAITRVSVAEGMPAAWSFGIEASAGFVGWPEVVSKILPQVPVAATLDVEQERIKLTISRFTGPLTLPDITISGTTVELGTIALDLSDFSLMIGRASDAASTSSIELDATIGIGLPEELNYMFGTHGNQPAVHFFRTYVEGDPQFVGQGSAWHHSPGFDRRAGKLAD